MDFLDFGNLKSFLVTESYENKTTIRLVCGKLQIFEKRSVILGEILEVTR